MDDDFIDDGSIERGKYDSDDYEDSDDDDSDDDRAISSLKSPKSKKASKKKKTTTTKSKPKKKAATTKKRKSARTSKSKFKKTTSTKKKRASSSLSAQRLASAELYAKCPKGKLVQAVLCRWWYTYTWPDPNAIPSEPPKRYDALDGFPGVFICSSGDVIGRILDTRDRSTCPSFQNFARKSSEELRTLLVEAIANQRRALVEAEEEGTETEEQLDILLRWAN